MLLGLMSRHHEVGVIAAIENGERMEELRELDLKFVHGVERHRFSSVARALKGRVAGRSLQVELLNEPGWSHSVDIVRRFEPDIIHMNVIRSLGFLNRITHDSRVVYDFDEVRSDYYDQLRSNSTGIRSRVLGAAEARPLRKAEREAVRRSAVALVSSPLDVGRLSGIPNHLVRSPTAWSNRSEVVEYKASPAEAFELLFVGRLGYDANRQAIEWFVDQVWSKFRAQCPTARLTIVGENPGHLVRLSGGGVEVTGRVDDLEPYYARASLAIVPVALGTGVQLKLIQAMQAGRPVMCTPEVLVRSGAPADCAITPGSAVEWIEQLVLVAGSEGRERLTKLVERAQRWVHAEYSDEAIYSQLAAAYDSALETET